MKYLLIYCAGGLGKEVITLAEIINEEKHTWDEIAFIDDVREETVFFEHTVYKYEEALRLRADNEVEVVIANGEPKVREMLWNRLEKDAFIMANLIYPSPFISPYAKVGKGVIIRERVSLSMDTVIEDNVFIQANVTIGHDTRIGSHSIISSFVGLSGNCDVGKRVYISMGVVTKQDISIGDNAIISLGSTIFRNVKENKIVMGNPAKVIGENEENSVFNMFE